MLFRLGAVICFIFVACQPEREIIQPDRIDLLNTWLDSNRRTPAEMVVEAISDNKVPVFVQDDIRRADTIELLKAMFPLFADLGIRKIGFGFFSTLGQQSLDMFYKDESVNADDVLMASNAASGYMEYRDLLIYLKDFQFSFIAMKQNNGSLDKAIAENLLKDEKSVLWILSEDVADLPEPMLLSEQDGNNPENREPVLISHFGPYGDGLRWDGLVEYVQKSRDIRDGSFAFNPQNQPFADWKYSSEKGFDIVLVTNFSYKSVTPIKNFIKQVNIAHAARFFPEIRFSKESQFVANKMNRAVRKQARQYSGFLKDVINN